MKPIKESKLLTLALALVLALGVLSASIAVPILCRSFYYAQIGPLGLEEYTGLNEEVIRQAYDGVLDYCTGKTETFSAGLLPFSDSGESHFADVRNLFLLDLWVLGLSLAALVLLLLLARRQRLRPPAAAGAGSGVLGGRRTGGSLPPHRGAGRPGL